MEKQQGSSHFGASLHGDPWENHCCWSEKLGDKAINSEKYVLLLTRLLKTYLTVATFDRKGNQYWKTSLVDDLGRLIDVAKLDGRGMNKIVRVLYDYHDVDQFAEILERMGR